MAARPKALVVKLSSLGDVFHALPAVQQLHDGLGLDIHWVTQPEYGALVACFDPVSRVLPFPRRRFFRELPGWLRVLRAEPYEYVFDFQGLIKSALTGRLARAGRRVGPSFHREGAWLAYDAVAGRRDRRRHAVDEALDFVRHFDLPVQPPAWKLNFPAAGQPGPSPRVGYLPCSRWVTKNWPPAHFAKLLPALHAQCGGSAWLFGSPADRAVCDALAQAAPEAAVFNRCGATSLVELGGELAGLDLLITVDSGPMHMAAALGVPVLALFGATDPGRTGPYGAGHRVLQHGGLDCQPCGSRRCLRTEQDNACLQELAPERVLEAALQMLGR